MLKELVYFAVLIVVLGLLNLLLLWYTTKDDYSFEPFKYIYKPPKGVKTVVKIKKYIKKNGVWKTVIVENQIMYHDLTDFSWKWISEIGQMGWVEDTPPPELSIIASDGMLEIANKILLNSNKKT